MQKSELFPSGQEQLLEKVKDQFPQLKAAACSHRWKIYSFDEDTGIGVWRCVRCDKKKERQAKFMCAIEGASE